MTAELLMRGTESRAANATKKVAGHIVIATINREAGDTGVHAHTRSLVAGLRKAANQAEIISAFDGSRLWLGIFGVRRLLLDRINSSWSTRWHRYWHRVALQRALLKRFKNSPPAAVIAQCPLSARAAMHVRAALRSTFPVVAVCHFNHSEATEYREKGELSSDRAFNAIVDFEQDVLTSVDAMVFVSEFSRDVVERQRSIRPKRSAVIWNGIESNAPSGVDRASLGVNEDDVVLINVGSLEGRKNQIGLLDLFATLAGRWPRSRLLLVGDGPDRADIERKIEKLNLTARVRMLGFRRDVPQILASGDLYVHYAKLENCPVVLLEAARAGLPIATMPAGGAAEVLAALGAGVVLDPNDIQRSTDDLVLLLERSSERRAIGATTRAGFEKRFTVEAMVDQYMNVISGCQSE